MANRRYWLASLLATGCGLNDDFLDPEVRTEKLSALQSPSIDRVDEGGDELRRAYHASDIKLAPCAVLLEDKSIEAKDCANGIVTFGPYVSAPSNADISLSFDITSAEPIFVASDIVSGGRNFHGALGLTAVTPGSKRHVGYKIHLFEVASGIEARIGVEATSPSTFNLSNLRIAIE
jgi:hypothetical protein